MVSLSCHFCVDWLDLVSVLLDLPSSCSVLSLLD